MNRNPKPDDHEKARQALDLLVELVKLNPDIENNFWVSAFFSSAAAMFAANNYSYHEFCKETQKAIEFYKYMWEI